jgi:hypothetical protein
MLQTIQDSIITTPHTPSLLEDIAPPFGIAVKFLSVGNYLLVLSLA